MPGRSDNVTDPALVASLQLMRRGQAYWARLLNQLRDEAFDEPSGLPRWTRRHLIAHVGFNARAIARLVEWARTGVENPMYVSDTQRAEEIAFGSTLTPEALRNLCAHAAVHLNVEWRDLPEEAWSHQVRTAQGRAVPVSETVWMRTREVWIHAVDLRNGGAVSDFPPELHDLLLEDLPRVWRRKRKAGERDVILDPSDRTRTYGIFDGDQQSAQEPLVVRGRASDLVAWGIGRPDGHVTTDTGAAVPAAPQWL